MAELNQLITYLCWYAACSNILIRIQDMAALAASEGWEYAPLFNMKFHAKENKMDLVRRRRWHRKMKPSGPNIKPCYFSFDGEVRPCLASS